MNKARTIKKLVDHLCEDNRRLHQANADRDLAAFATRHSIVERLAPILLQCLTGLTRGFSEGLRDRNGASGGGDTSATDDHGSRGETTRLKICLFLNEQTFSVEPCDLIELAYVQPGTLADVFRTWDRKRYPEIFKGAEGLDTLASEVLRNAMEHAASFGDDGSHRFEVRAKHTDRRPECGQSFAFRLVLP